MKKTLVTIASIMLASASLASAGDFTPAAVKVERSESFLNCEFTLKLDSIDISSNKQLHITPIIAGNENDSLALPELVVAGRNRHILISRRLREQSDSLLLYRFHKGMTIDYAAHTEFLPWMDSARLVLRSRLEGCCGKSDTETTLTVAALDFRRRVFEGSPVYIMPATEGRKTRALQGTAFVDFAVNSSRIMPDYRGNAAELAGIRASIDSVRADSDATITALTIKGYASPEGPWANNARLAAERTEALRTYVERLFDFAPGLISTSSEPEDWDGLRRHVAASDIADRTEILAIIDSTLPPDERETRIRKEFPAQYAMLLADVYPSLRHTDYRIDYTVRSYVDPAEMLEVFKTRPGNLSLGEFFTAAQAIEPGSQLFNDLFETAVRLFPESETANLNAAAAAIARGDLAGARRFLGRAGQSPEADHNRGIAAALEGDFESALPLLENAAKGGLTQAADAAAEVKSLMER